MDAKDYKAIMKQWKETVSYVQTLNSKRSENGKWDEKAAREAYIQQYEQRLARYEWRATSYK